MLILILELTIMLVVIVVAAILFTNSLEHIGQRLKISDGLTGSVFAAIGTALPETVIPILAIASTPYNLSINSEIGMGSILGAPLMLSTLCTTLMALSVVNLRGITGIIEPERTGFIRDLNFFILSFLIVLITAFIPEEKLPIKVFCCGILLIIYIVYIFLVIRASKKLVNEGYGTKVDEPIMLTKLKFPDNSMTLLLQLIISLSLLVIGAKGFIHEIEKISNYFGIPAFLITIFIAPLATEMPEKISSILWIRKKKDTLAFGNITGAMVFQASLLPVIGILFTPWKAGFEFAGAIIITLIAAIWLRLNARKGGIPIWVLLLNGLCYLMYLIMILCR